MKKTFKIGLFLGCHLLSLVCFLLSTVGGLKGYELIIYHQDYFNIYGLITLLIWALLLAYPFIKQKKLFDFFLLMGILYAILLIVLPDIFFSFSSFQSNSLTTPWYYIGIVLAFISVIFMVMISEQEAYSIQDIAYLAVLIAMALVLDMIKIPLLAKGGSISLEMLPLFLIAIKFSFSKSFIAIGVIYGFLSSAMGGYGLAYYPFDYLLAFGALSLISLLRPFFKLSEARLGVKQFVVIAVALTIGVIARYLIATISGVLYWETPFVASLAYNSPSLISGGICIVVFLVSLPLLKRVIIR